MERRSREDVVEPDHPEVISERGPENPDPSIDEVSSIATDLDPSLPIEPLEAVIDPTTSRVWTRGDSIRVGVAVAALLGSGLLALRGVSSAEIDTFETVNTLPAFLYVILWPIMQLGNVWVAVTIAASVGLVMRRWRVAVILAAAPLLAWYLAKAVKTVVERGRPDTLGIAVNLRGGIESGYGYISGHATVSFALAGAIAAHLRRPWSALLFVAASIVAVARLYVGVHLPLDVIGGAACGLLIGELARVAEIHRRRRDTRRP